MADIGVGLVAILAGAAIVYLGDRLLGVRLELYFGVETFNPLWVLDLFFVPFIAGIIVSLVYGLGGKMLAHFSPVLIRLISFYELDNGLAPLDGATMLPMAYWVLLVIVAAEFAAIGGVVGEIIVKKTYGRTANKALLHRKFKQKASIGAGKDSAIAARKESIKGAD